MKISLASDHAGFDYKEQISLYLTGLGYEIIDFGAFSLASTDYPDHAFAAAKAVADGICERGIIICGTGIGVSITANKVTGIRSANCNTVEMAVLSRQHNDANVLNFGARLISIDLARQITDAFLNTEFEGGRHSGRIDKIHSLTGR